MIRTTKEDFIVAFVEQFKNLPADDVVALHNDYCNENSLDNKSILNREEFDDWYRQFTPTEIAVGVFRGDYNPNYEWCRFEEFNVPISTDNPFEFMDPRGIAEWVYEDKIDLTDYGIGLSFTMSSIRNNKE